MQISQPDRKPVEFDTRNIPNHAKSIEEMLGEAMATVASSESSGKPLPALSRSERRALERRQNRVRVTPAKARPTS